MAQQASFRFAQSMELFLHWCSVCIKGGKHVKFHNKFLYACCTAQHSMLFCNLAKISAPLKSSTAALCLLFDALYAQHHASAAVYHVIENLTIKNY